MGKGKGKEERVREAKGKKKNEDEEDRGEREWWRGAIFLQRWSLCHDFTGQNMFTPMLCTLNTMQKIFFAVECGSYTV
jgi:hypothetical protein